MNHKGVVRAGLTLAVACVLALSAMGMAQAASPASCRRITYRGPDGYLAVQTSPSGWVAWGGGLNIKADEAGHYTIDVLVNGRRADRKNQHYPYFPHGSLPPSHAPSGATFVLHVDLQSDSGRHY